MTRTSHSARILARSPRAWTAVLAAAASLGLALVAHATPAHASKTQTAFIQDGAAVGTNPTGTMNTFHALGATTIRYLAFWKQYAPRKPPKGSKASSPSAYLHWDGLDAIVKEAKTQHMRLDLNLVGPPPTWAQGPGIPSDANRKGFGWKPNAKYYGQWVHAVAQRYSGKYKVGGKALPRVSFWTLWNEPNFGQDLGPQAVKATSKFNGYSVAPMYYRQLLRSGWSALNQTGHGKDTRLIGELAAEGRSGPKNGAHPQGLPGNYAQTVPLQFIRTLYCVDAKNKPLRGTVAKYAGCPTNSSGTRSFRKQNPALFTATGASIHPYASKYKPDAKTVANKDYAVFPAIGRFGRTLDRVNRAYGSNKHYPVYSTEYGFVTNPPNHQKGYPSPTTAATYLNQAEYISYRNPRIQSYSQYLLNDPFTVKGSQPFASGLYTSSGKPKATLAAYRLPLWMPSQSFKRNSSPEVWGAARPASFAYGASHQAQRVQIQLRQGSSWKTLKTVTASKTNGYFDTHVKFSAGGSVRLAYTYPKSEPFLPMSDVGKTIYSRTIKVKVK